MTAKKPSTKSRTPRKLETVGKGADWSMPDQLCPACGHHLNAAARHFDGSRPKPGDLTVCIACITVLEIGPDFQLGVASDATLASLDPEARAELAEAMRLLRIYARLQAATAKSH